MTNHREIDEQMGELQRQVTWPQWKMIEKVVSREFPPGRGVSHTSHMDSYRAGLLDLYQGCIDAIRDQEAGQLRRHVGGRSGRDGGYSAMAAVLGK